MTDTAELRTKARLCRLAASVPTTGGTRADRVLIALAERLEREAIVLEQLETGDETSEVAGKSRVLD